jgi:transposase
MSKIGKPTKLTPRLQEQICQLLRQGNFIQTVCSFVGIDKTSFYLYMRLGERATEGIHYEFRKAVLKSQAEAEMRMLRHIVEAAQTDWCASAWRLERKFPKKYGRFDDVQRRTTSGIPTPKKANVR